MSSVPEAPFEIVEIVATGAYGTVAVARFLEEDGRLVAVKAMRSDHLNRPKILARARDEARMLFRLQHPNIVRLEQLLEVGGRPVLLMEWVEGVSMRELLDEVQRVPAPVAVEMARQIALALDAAYNAVDADGGRLRIIHRDIKPANVLLSVNGRVKIVDFGVAIGDFDDRETVTVSTIMGTHGYMAPERLDGVADSPAIDVYALGVTLYELLTGRMPQLPSAPDQHAHHLARRLERIVDLGSSEAEEAQFSRIAEIVGEMCNYQHEMRPTACKVQEALAEWAATVPGGADLERYATEWARPIYEARRPAVSVTEHPEYAELAFLERPWSAVSVQPAGPADLQTTLVEEDSPADQKLRAFLAEAGWFERRKDLTWLLAMNSGWTERPFLEVLDRHEAPWWKVWVRRPGAREVRTVLIMLRYRRNGRVKDRVRGLRHSADPDIAGAARALVDND